MFDAFMSQKEKEVCRVSPGTNANGQFTKEEIGTPINKANAAQTFLAWKK